MDGPATQVPSLVSDLTNYKRLSKYGRPLFAAYNDDMDSLCSITCVKLIRIFAAERLDDKHSCFALLSALILLNPDINYSDHFNFTKVLVNLYMRITIYINSACQTIYTTTYIEPIASIAAAS